MMSRLHAFTEEYTLSPETVDRISQRLETVCTAVNMDSKTAKRYRLSIEECLLFWLEKLGEGAHVSFEFGSRMLRPCFSITVDGARCNPYEQQTEDFGSGSKNMLVSIGLIPSYSYHNGSNVILFSVKRKPKNQVLSLLLVIASALLVGLLGKLFIPADIVSFINDGLILPVEDTFFKILSCIAGPMIFLSVAWGVYGIGDVYTLGRVGKRLMANYLCVVFLAAAVGACFYPLLGSAITSVSTQSSQFSKVFGLILNIFPSDIFSPFIEGNTLQIIFIAFIIGMSLIFLGQRTSSVARAIEQINNIITFLMSFISKLVPYFVFIVLVQMIWSDSLLSFGSVWKLAVVFICVFLLFHILFTVYVGIRHGINPFRLMKFCLPSFLIAFTTASSSATFESNMTITQRKLGVSNAFSSFSVPFGMVLYKPSTALYYLLFCFYMSSIYGVQVSLSWIVTAVIITAVSSVATPPIPGGAAATYAILFSQLGIPAEAIAVALAVDMIFDFVMTAGDMYSLLLEVFNVSVKIGMQDKKILPVKRRAKAG